MKVDYLIIGQGLAGSAMALQLLESGASVLVVDKERQNSASRVAAGLVTTLAGKGMNPAWRQGEYLAEARAFYARLEEKSGRKLFYEMGVLKAFEDQKQAEKFERKKGDVAEWYRELDEEDRLDLDQWGDGSVRNDIQNMGGFMMRSGGRLDTLAYLEVVREVLGDSYVSGEFCEEKLEYVDDEVRYDDFGLNIRAKAIILCQGVDGLVDSRFSMVEHRSAKGEMLVVRIEKGAARYIISKNGWLVPLGNDLYKVGATYEWKDLEGGTSAEGRAEVERRLRSIIGDASYEVIDHVAGVRPIIRKSQPLVGSHPEYPWVKFFNGLGSKGVTSAPSVARHFAEHLVQGTRLDPELDLREFLA